jgi:hypothetical protein
MITWLADALRAEGLDVREVPGWKTRGRPFTFVGTEGVLEHHTASNPASGPRPALRTVTDGRSDLPGPLCQLLIDRIGIVWVIAAGYANHGGWGGPWRSVPLDSANKYMVGIEIENNGLGEPYSKATMLAARKATVAILKHQKRDQSWVLGHKEWTSRKINPSFDMNKFRRDVKEGLEGGMAILTPDEEKQLRAFMLNLREATKKPDGSTRTPAALGRQTGRTIKVVEKGVALPEHTHPVDGNGLPSHEHSGEVVVS